MYNRKNAAPLWRSFSTYFNIAGLGMAARSTEYSTLAGGCIALLGVAAQNWKYEVCRRLVRPKHFDPWKR